MSSSVAKVDFPKEEEGQEADVRLHVGRMAKVGLRLLFDGAPPSRVYARSGTTLRKVDARELCTSMPCLEARLELELPRDGLIGPAVGFGEDGELTPATEIELVAPGFVRRVVLVTLSTERTPVVEYQLKRPEGLFGKIIDDSTGRSVAGARVFWVRTATLTESSTITASDAYSGPDGRFALPLAAGTEHEVSVLSRSFRPKTISVASGMPREVEIRLERAQ